MDRFKKLIAEIHRRSLWQVLLIYIGAAWACFELIATVADTMGLPGWLPGLAIVLFLLGLPFVVATALVREEAAPLTERAPAPEAVVEAERHAAVQRRRFLTWRNAGLSFLVALAMWGVAAAGWMLFGGEPAESGAVAEERPSVAALPFLNLSGREEDGFFTDGIHGEILTQLQKIGGLKVVSRTSVMPYRDSPKNARQIGADLNAGYLLEGEILRAADEVRVNVQLIDCRTDDHVWAEIYDRALSIENLLDVQSEIAQQIAVALKTELTPEERARIDARPTEDLDAYQAYLRGQYYMHLPHFTVANLNRALDEFEQAVELDSMFALAHAQLALAQAQKVFYWIDASQSQRDLATSTVQRAVRVAPESPNVRLALGLYHLWLHRDPRRAMEEIDRAAEQLPDKRRVLVARAAVYELQGRFEDALDVCLAALELSPKDASIHSSLAKYNWMLRRYGEGEAEAELAMTLAPDQLWPRLYKTFIIWSDRGANEESEAVLEVLPRDNPWVRWARYWQRMYEDRYLEAVEVLSESEVDWVRLKTGSRPRALLEAWAYQAMGRGDRARELFEEARLALEKEIETQPEDPRYHSSLGLTYAGLGMSEQALREGERAVEVFPLSTDAFYGIPYLLDLAAIYAMVGDAAAAVDQVGYLLTIPSWVSPKWLEGDFRFDSLRDHPRFHALVAKYE
jgi:TolB-like protein/Tfp pilus assembly protein PilF